MANLEKIFNPQTIAVVGATDRKGSVGLGLCQNLLQSQVRRKLFFVNPYRQKVFGQRTYELITDIKESIDLAVIAVPAKIVPHIVNQAILKRVGGIIIISAGFGESGKTGRFLEEKISEAVKKARIPLLGPNCLGLIRPAIGLNASFAPAMPPVGEIAFVSQSGALIDSVIDQSFLENYGFSTIISYGNEAGSGLADFLLWLKDDRQTKAIALYVENIKQGREFIKAARQAVKQKPIVVLKAGQTQAGSRAIVSHTGNLVGLPQIYSAAFQQTGIFEVNTLEALFDVAKALAWQPRIENSIGIITNGGGAGVLAADYAEQRRVRLAKLSQSTIKRLEQSKSMSLGYSRTNPLDLVGDALAQRYEAAVKAMLSQNDIGGLLVIQTLQIMTESEKNARILIKVKNKWPHKAIIACFLGGKLTKPAIDLLEKNKIPNYSDPARAVRALKALSQ